MEQLPPARAYLHALRMDIGNRCVLPFIAPHRGLVVVAVFAEALINKNQDSIFRIFLKLFGHDKSKSLAHSINLVQETLKSLLHLHLEAKICDPYTDRFNQI